MGVDDSSFFSIPAFEKDELSEFLISLGLKDANRAHQYAEVLIVKTGGHAQLVNAFALHLKAKNFEISIGQAIIEQPSDVTNLRRSALQTIQYLCDLPAQNYIWKLSVVSGLFTRAQALQIALHAPVVDNPGLVFDRLTGPWIETLSNGYFRVSPLIDNSGSEILGIQSLVRLNVLICNAILTSPKISIPEFATAFIHAWRSQDPECLKHTAISVLRFTDKILWQNLSDHMSWFPLVEGSAHHLFKDDYRVNLLLRALQFRIAILSSTANPKKITGYWDEETAIQVKEQDEDKLKGRFHFIFLVVSQCEYLPFVSVEYLVKLIIEAKLISDKLPSFSTDNSFNSPLSAQISPSTDTPPLSSLMLFIIPQCKSLAKFKSLFEGLEKLSDDDRSFIFSSTHHSNFLNNHWINIMIHNESKKDDPDWHAVTGFLNIAIEKSRAWNNQKFTDALLKGLLRVFSQLGDAAQAIASVDSYLNNSPESFTVMDAKANSLYDSGEHKPALEIWERILFSQTLTSDDPSILFSYRSAAMIYSREGDFSNAYRLLIEAASVALRYPNQKQQTAFKAEAATCLWEMKDYSNFLLLMEEVLSELEQIPNDPKDLESFALHKLLGHSMSWYEATITNLEIDLFKPFAGMYTNPKFDDRILALNETPIYYTWLNLVLIEDALGLNSIFLRRKNYLVDSPYPFVRRMVLAKDLEKTFTSAPGEIIKKCIAIRRETRLLDLIKPNLTLPLPRSTPLVPSADDHEAVRVNSLLYITLLILVQKQKDVAVLNGLIDTWRKSFEPGNPRLTGELVNLQKLLEQSPDELVKMARSDSESFNSRIFSACLTLLQPDLASNDEAFYVQMIIHKFLLDFKVPQTIIDLAAHKTANYWRNAIKSPAFLKAPQINVPNIKAACENELTGSGKICSILLAVYPAQNIVVETRVIDTWKKELGDLLLSD